MKAKVKKILQPNKNNGIKTTNLSERGAFMATMSLEGRKNFGGGGRAPTTKDYITGR